MSLLVDVPGLRVGHASLGDTGVTAVVAEAPAGMVAGVDVRGGGPGTRETDLLEPHNTVERVHAIVQPADLRAHGGHLRRLPRGEGPLHPLGELERAGRGFPVLGEGRPGPRVPIVPAAVIFDLFVGDATHRPTARDGAAAVRAALEGTGEDASRRGSVGAGCGATAGVLRGGVGQASVTAGEYTVSALVVANPVGSVIDPDTGRLWGDPAHPPVDLEKFAALEHPAARLNTTIGVVATDAPVTTAQVTRLAMVGHDGLARAVRPAHSPLDGDTLFSVSTAAENALSDAAADVVERAVVDAVVSAGPGHGIGCWAEIARH